jgi:hypothetical protein
MFSSSRPSVNFSDNTFGYMYHFEIVILLKTKKNKSEAKVTKMMNGYTNPSTKATRRIIWIMA